MSDWNYNNFNDGLKINNDLNNKKEGPHWDIMTDLRKDIEGIDKLRISSDGTPLGGETQIGPHKIKW